LRDWTEIKQERSGTRLQTSAGQLLTAVGRLMVTHSVANVISTAAVDSGELFVDGCSTLAAVNSGRAIRTTHLAARPSADHADVADDAAASSPGVVRPMS